MAIFRIVEGQPGQGKSLHTARQARSLLRRNSAWHAKRMARFELAHAKWESEREWRLGLGMPEIPEPVAPEKRILASNIKFSESFEKKWGIYDGKDGWIKYWTRLDELHHLRHVDLIWDEIATELDARNWPNLSPETMRMLSQYRKRGIDIYANTQDFSMVDVRARLMITSVATLTKLIGSPDPSATKPEVKKVWGVVLIRGVENWKETQAEKKRYSFFNWSMMLIERELVDMYDTTQDIQHGGYPALRHVERFCEDPSCEVHKKGKVLHV